MPTPRTATPPHSSRKPAVPVPPPNAAPERVTEVRDQRVLRAIQPIEASRANDRHAGEVSQAHNMNTVQMTRCYRHLLQASTRGIRPVR
jgi:hypothetical protein